MQRDCMIQGQQIRLDVDTSRVQKICTHGGPRTNGGYSMKYTKRTTQMYADLKSMRQEEREFWEASRVQDTEAAISAEASVAPVFEVFELEDDVEYIDK